MIHGFVTATREAIIRLSVRGPGENLVEIDAVLDTGFNDELTLPPALIATLGLTALTPAEAMLADEVVVQTSYYRATVLWDARPRAVSILEIEGVPLIGMGLVWQHRVTIDARSGGNVTIERLESA